jgi:arylsulfatase A-like enzyme/multidrug efflux pump subunit AcrA (membrane-fusion protein)
MNLIFCSLDTLRSDRLSCLGHSRGLTPNLDRIASEGALFSQAFATDIPTQPSHTAMFTGQFGVNTGIVSHFHPAAYLDEETLWLPSVMRRHGYTTGAVDHLFAMKDWFIRGYDDYMPPPGRSRSPGSVINEIGFPWIVDHADEDFFLFLHFWDTHIPYLPPSPFKERFTFRTAGRIDPLVPEKLEGRPSYPLFKQNLYDFLDSMPNLDYIADLYDAEVAYLDFEIGRLFNHLGELGLLDDTMVVLFGDHGENMTEHDAWFDHAGLYDSVVHVPLILWAPGRVPVVDSPAMVTLVDVLPTVLEILGLPEADGIDGRSLMPLMRGEATVHRDVVMLSEATWQASRGVRTEEWKFIRYLQSTIYGRDGVELYHLPDDPDEQENVAELHPEVAEDMDARLHHWVAAQLAGRPDPTLSVIDAGLPAVARLNEVMAGQARPRHDVPAPAVPGHDLVPLAIFGPADSEPVDADRGQRFAPFNPHRRRLRSARGVLVSVVVVAAALLLGVAVNDLLLSDPLSATGVVQPTTEAQLNMSATGPIASLPVHVGQMVRAGQVLASQDTTAIAAKLSADQSKLAADQAMLQQQQAGTQTVQLQQLKDQVGTAQVQQVTAQQKLNQTEVTTDASVAAAQEQVQADQTLLNADQQTYQDEEPQCLSPTPPAACGSDQRQVQVDQGNLMSSQSGYNQALAQQQAQIGAAQSGVTQATSAVTNAQAALAVGSAPATDQEIAGTEAAIEQDNANIATDKTHLAQAVLTAPFSGVVSSINGSVGEVATSQGIRQATAPGSVSQPSSSGIQIFPQGPQNQTTPAPTYAALVSLESTQTMLVVQVPETDIHQIHTGQKAEASLPAVSGSTMSASVTQIEPTPVTQSGQTYFLVDLVTTANAAPSRKRGSPSPADPPAPTQVGLTVDVSF